MFKELIENEGGFSYNPLIPQPLDGYMVSLPGYTKLIPLDEFSDEDVKDYWDKLPHFEVSCYFVGGWAHNGYVYLDVSEHVNHLPEAIEKAWKRNQVAIWDLANGVEIPTGGTGE